MPSLSHEALLVLLRNRPELVPELLREALGVELPAYTQVRVESADLTEVVPTEYHADLVVLLIDGRVVLASVVEAQLSKDERKRYTWPMYVASVRARFECPALVLVVTPSVEVARWAAEPLALGPGAWLTPLVLGPDRVPVVTDSTRTRAEPELGVLSAMAHGRGPVDQAVQVALAAASGLRAVEDRDSFVLYWDLILASLSEAARKAFEMLPESYEFQTESIRKSIEKGRVEGKIEGKIEGKAAAVCAILEARGLSLSDQQRERILETTDLETLDRWVRRAATIASADQLFV